MRKLRFRRNTTGDGTTGRVADEGDSPQQRETHGRMLIALTIACGVALSSGWLLEHFDVLSGNQAIAFYVAAYLAGGTHATVRAIRSLWNRRIDIDLLMVVAALGAATIGQWPEGAMLLFLFSLGNALQAYAMARTFRAVQALMDLSPDRAVVLRDGVETTVLVEEIGAGDLLLVRPGERIAVDGTVVSGESAVDQAAITGESIPVDKRKGDTVFSGTINGGGALTIEAMRAFGESTLARIIAIVAEAQSQKSATQRFTDRFEGLYAGGVIAAAVLYALLPFVLLGQSFADSFYQSMILLVVASPCALIISTPAATLSALANAARRGILIKGALQLEELGATRVVAFDKTGTLTVGRPRVTELRPAPGVSSETLLETAAAAEAHSEHPLATAIVEAAASRSLMLPVAENLQAHAGRGITATVNNATVFVGTDVLMAESGIAVPPGVMECLEELRYSGNTTMIVATRTEHGARVLGAIGLADTIRPEARDVVATLRAIGVDKTVILTGDNAQAARAIAHQAGIDDVRSGLLPREKLDVIETLKREHGSVVMVGDGVNDAPALAMATVGVALGAAGTDVALETADVVLMADDVSKLPYAIALSRRSRRIILQNLTFALTVIVVLVIGTLAGITTLPIGVIGHEGSTIIVVANGLRLLRGVRLDSLYLRDSHRSPSSDTREAAQPA